MYLDIKRDQPRVRKEDGAGKMGLTTTGPCEEMAA